MEQEIRNNLRNEYFKLLPVIRKILEEMEATIKYELIPIKKELESYERIEIQERIKECENAIVALWKRKRKQGSKDFFGVDEKYSLLELKDLAGIRFLVFPSSKINDVDKEILKKLYDWGSE